MMLTEPPSKSGEKQKKPKSKRKKAPKQASAATGRGRDIPVYKPPRKIPWILIISCLSILIVGTSVIIAVLTAKKADPTIIELRCGELKEAMENDRQLNPPADPYLINKCHDLEKNCDLDVGTCQYPCPLGYQKDKATGCFTCECAHEGLHEYDLMFDENDVSTMLKDYGHRQIEAEVEEFSLFTSSVTDWTKLWDTKIDGRYKVPFEMGPDIIAGAVTNIMLVVKHFSEVSCIDFVHKTEEDLYYLTFIRGQGCYSKVGMQAFSGQHVSIGYGCSGLGTIMHELNHALAFMHEHARPDRDVYLDMHEENVKPNDMSSFKKMDPDRVTDTDSEYDIGSVMQYNGRFGSKNGSPTLTLKGTDTVVEGNLITLSDTDIEELNYLYKCAKENIGQKLDAKWSVWAEWGECSESCYLDVAKPFHTRFRKCVDEKGNQFASCKGKASQREECDIPYCPKADGKWSPWEAWTTCSKSCGKGSRNRKRDCETGKQCSEEYGSYFNYGKCNTHKCGEEPTLRWTGWSIWLWCTATCGKGVQVKRRECKFGDELVQTCEGGNYNDEGLDIVTRPCEVECTTPKTTTKEPPTTPETAAPETTKAAPEITTTEPETTTTVPETTTTTVPETTTTVPTTTRGGWFAVDKDRNSNFCMYGLIRTGDFNNDGRNDILCLFNDGYIRVYFAQSSGDYENVDWEGKTRFCEFSEEISPDGKAKEAFLFARDLNGDGYDDMLCYNKATGNIEVLINKKGKSMFEEKLDWKGTRESCDVRAGAVIQLQDVNGDGKSDLLCGDSKNAVKEIFLNEM